MLATDMDIHLGTACMNTDTHVHVLWQSLAASGRVLGALEVACFLQLTSCRQEHVRTWHWFSMSGQVHCEVSLFVFGACVFGITGGLRRGRQCWPTVLHVSGWVSIKTPYCAGQLSWAAVLLSGAPH